MPAFIDRSNTRGQTFHWLTSLGEHEIRYTDKRRYTQWLFRCRCSKIVKSSWSAVVQGYTKSCGCRKGEHQKIEEGLSAKKKKFTILKSDARRRGLPISLSFDEFVKISEHECFYCHEKPKSICIAKGNGDFIFNGIDRRCNAKGYVQDNVLAACEFCNFFKKGHSLQCLIEKASKVANRNVYGDIISDPLSDTHTGMSRERYFPFCKNGMIHQHKCKCGRVFWSELEEDLCSKPCRGQRTRIERGYGAAFLTKTYGRYQKEATKRGIYFGLREELFSKIIRRPCFYCGIKPSMLPSSKSFYGIFPYNGIDRVDNSRGYTINNSRPCCPMCNHGKRTLKASVFVENCRRISEIWKERDLEAEIQDFYRKIFHTPPQPSVADRAGTADR